jgi:DNA processing protein
MDEISMDLLRGIGLTEDSAMKAMVRLENFNIADYASKLTKRDVFLLTLDDAEYPEQLRSIPDAPVFLYMRGDLSILSQPCIGIVGSREMSEYGRRVVGHIVPPMVAAGVVTVSGLAFGIDAEVARETIHASGKTVAVLGHGLGMMYPKANEKLSEKIIENGGLLISEFPLDVIPDKHTFPARNRIIAGLSLATVVAEAAEGSGSLITAELALEYGREVGAVPGDLFHPNYAGCHQLIAKGHAKLVTNADDILAEVGIVASSRAASASTFSPSSPEESAIYSALTTLPVPIDDLSVKTKLDAATINAVLTILEIQGVVKNVGGGKWVRH